RQLRAQLPLRRHSDGGRAEPETRAMELDAVRQGAGAGRGSVARSRRRAFGREACRQVRYVPRHRRRTGLRSGLPDRRRDPGGALIPDEHPAAIPPMRGIAAIVGSDPARPSRHESFLIYSRYFFLRVAALLAAIAIGLYIAD